MHPNDLAPLTERDIAEYLMQNQGFFQRNPELLTDLHLGSAHGQRVVSLHERQAEMLREKIKVLEQRLIDMIRHGSENSVTTNRLLHWVTNLSLEHNAAALPARICTTICEQFMVPQAAIRVWGVDAAYAACDFAQGVNSDTKSFASSLTTPYCGMHVGVEAVRWLDEPLLAASLALIPLRDATKPQSPAFGLLVLASPDANRYQDDMATDYLEHIGKMASAALSRLTIAPAAAD
ncbi:MAG: DUF484 family protein [Brachymonas sp.]|jgi:uncharacterized protein YigA (DUF484 family)|nr:DUF484 family protein [Brachymonas sp.]MBP6966565.1 DUF484 family protein [Brachymonas sp.]MBP7246870.1 DUF484 family protein [Brachymonas sp.]MBP7734251.1 DUF484 family protein [Brachymonas sp.]MBP7739949.1 DUF484 family protein [Brachymonas sp.]